MFWSQLCHVFVVCWTQRVWNVCLCWFGLTQKPVTRTVGLSIQSILPRYTLFYETVFTQIVLFLSGGLLVQPLEIRGNFGQLLFREHCFWDFFFLFHKWWIKTSPLGLWLYLGCWVVSMEPPLGCIHSVTSRSLALLEVIAAVDL